MKNETTHPVQTQCPICQAATDQTGPHYPFCSKRCQTIDLGRWTDGSYKISRPIEQRDLEEGVD
ncbi:MAG: DNA gyrase inhibitor YacG [Phycisphaerales bacterium JB063]